MIAIGDDWNTASETLETKGISVLQSEHIHQKMKDRLRAVFSFHEGIMQGIVADFFGKLLDIHV